MVELGGGWGARAVTAHAMLKQIKPHVREFYIVVEAMRDHCGWIRKHMQDNGIDANRHSIIHAAIWVDNQPKLFPDCAGILGQSISYDAPDCVADLTPQEAKESLLNVVRNGELGIVDPFESRGGRQSRKWSFVSTVTLRDILLPIEQMDYIDIDIQGAEQRLILDGIDLLEERVKRLHVGTHSDEIHAKLTELFETRGWQVLVQIPPDGEYSSEWGDFSTSDGILSVVNRRLGQ
jgi:FkbM family methyltransferase